MALGAVVRNLGLRHLALERNGWFVSRPLQPGMVFHLPATLRDYGHFTVGASETVIITEPGLNRCQTCRVVW